MEHSSRENLFGILLMAASMAMFAIEDMFIKKLSAHMPMGQILVILGLGGFFLFSMIAWSKGQRMFSRELLLWPVIIRNLGEVIGSFGYLTAVITTSLSGASAILQATPLAVALGAGLFLGQDVGWRRWVAIAIGFIGVLIVIRPGMSGFEPASLFAVIGVIGLSMRDLATRLVPKNISSTRLSGFGFGVLVPAAAVLMIFEAPAQMPDIDGMWLVLAALIFGPLGYYAIVAAMRIGEVAIITPFRYTRLPFAMLIGIIAFGENPDFWTYFGASIIILTGLFTIYREQVARNRARALSLTTNDV